MLEEIIVYAKFLQLQTKVCGHLSSAITFFSCFSTHVIHVSALKVLSMSRLGSTEAVVPLLRDSQNDVEKQKLFSVHNALYFQELLTDANL